MNQAFYHLSACCEYGLSPITVMTSTWTNISLPFNQYCSLYVIGEVLEIHGKMLYSSKHVKKHLENVALIGQFVSQTLEKVWDGGKQCKDEEEKREDKSQDEEKKDDRSNEERGIVCESIPDHLMEPLG